MKKETKGITLIALVITIIVLLILAGVTISAITGNESIMEKAQSAKEKTDMSNEKEAIQLAAINSIIGESNDLKINNEALETNLAGIIERKIEPKNGEEITNEWCVEGKTGEKYIIDEEGNVMTAYEKAKKDISLKVDVDEGYPRAVRREGKEYVQYKYPRIVPEEYEVKTCGYIWTRKENINDPEIDTNMLKIENIGQENRNIGGTIVYTSEHTGFVRIGVQDYGYGTFSCGFVQVEDKYGNEFDIYTEVYNYSFSILSANGVVEL